MRQVDNHVAEQTPDILRRAVKIDDLDATKNGFIGKKKGLY